MIPKETYNNQTEDIHTVGVKAVLLVSDKLPEKTVKALTKTLFENKQELQYALPVNIVMNEQTATEGITIPFHKGAAAYYKECGIDVVTGKEADRQQVDISGNIFGYVPDNYCSSTCLNVR